MLTPHIESLIEQTRNRVLQTLDRHGEFVIIRQRYRPFDGQPSCPYCYDEDYKQATISRCTKCFGVGFKDGYKPPVLTKATLGNAEEQIEQTQTGFVRIKQIPSAIGWEPILHDGDLLVSVDVDPISGEIIQEYGRFQIKNVQHQKLYGKVVSQIFYLSKVQPNALEMEVPIYLYDSDEEEGVQSDEY